MTSFRSWFALMFPAVAVCLMTALFPSSALCAEDDDPKIFLPTKKDPKTASEQVSAVPRANEMLQGVIYDLKLTKNRQSSGMGVGKANQSRFLQTIRQFVLGSWVQRKDSDNVTRYPELDSYFCLPTRLGNSYFYSVEVDNVNAPKLLHPRTEDKLSDCL